MNLEFRSGELLSDPRQPYVPRIAWHTTEDYVPQRDYGDICREYNLKPAYCRIIYPMRMRGYNVHEIAQLTGLNKNTVKIYTKVLKNISASDFLVVCKTVLLEIS